MPGLTRCGGHAQPQASNLGQGIRTAAGIGVVACLVMVALQIRHATAKAIASAHPERVRSVVAPL